MTTPVPSRRAHSDMPTLAERRRYRRVLYIAQILSVVTVSIAWRGSLSENQSAYALLALVMFVAQNLLGAYYLKLNRWRRARIAARITSNLLGLAILLAGRRRSHLGEEWRAILAGDPEGGLDVSPRERRRHAAGFLLAAVRMRLRDAVRPAWIPVDWLLATDSRSNAFIAAVVGAQAIYIVGDGGLAALVTEIWEPCGILGAGLSVLTRWLRKVRGIELASAQPPAE
ncbi:hypothetical protein [Streptomyces sp. NPDC002187]|uniref:hypothetical protein n=1 Tax=Streptomyces sp. NPDC002187 TaxID=3364637 RepID=UPI00367C0993